MSYRGFARINISLFRDCLVANHRVVIPPPILFGRGYVFDGNLKIVSIRVRCLGMTISIVELPFQDIRSVTLNSKHYEATSIAGNYTSERTYYQVVMTVTGGREYNILGSDSLGLQEYQEEILTAIRQVAGVR